ncbi:MAG: RimK family alpha-L-glutamate ligase, partial [Firmicutes bacterium]|nr:RimK family alpha-L-glutamate ligase [Bacillota bacterium]
TDVNNHTYDFARYAYSEGLVVIDDPWSILKCSNKIYLYERLRKNNINMPDTFILNQHQFKPGNYKNVTFPLILKKPDSAFSKGVFKVTNQKMFLEKLKELFKSSQMILAQEYIESAFDWRIGVLNNKAIYACKYYMSKGHWQIYNWHDQDEFDGLVDTLKLEDVPEKVLKAAVKAASLIGNGLYGVDLKEKDDKVYLIEVNDNPSIDHGIEDAVYGYKIYQDIMNYLFTSIDRERNITRYVSQSK